MCVIRRGASEPFPPPPTPERRKQKKPDLNKVKKKKKILLDFKNGMEIKISSRITPQL